MLNKSATLCSYFSIILIHLLQFNQSKFLLWVHTNVVNLIKGEYLWAVFNVTGIKRPAFNTTNLISHLKKEVLNRDPPLQPMQEASEEDLDINIHPPTKRKIAKAIKSLKK